MTIVRFPKFGEEQAVQELFAKTWGADHIFARDEGFFRWQFSPSQLPFEVDTPLSILVAEESGRLEALLCLIGVKATISGQVVPGMWLANFRKLDDATSQDVGLKVIFETQRLPVDFIAASSVRTAVLPIFEALRYARYDHIDRWIKVVDHVNACSLLRRNADIHSMFSAPTPGNGFERVSNVCEMSFSEIGSEWDRFWTMNWRPNVNGIDRTSAYWDWRYAKNPRLDYRILVARAPHTGDLLGAVIFRVEQVRGADTKLLRLIEFWPLNDRVGYELLTALNDIAVASQASIIDYFVSNGHTEKSLELAGFQRDGIEDDALFASRFQPLDFAIPSFNVVFRSKGATKSSIPVPMTFLKSDGDQDRPN